MKMLTSSHVHLTKNRLINEDQVFILDCLEIGIATCSV